MPTPIPLTFLGTSSFSASVGYWNSFLIGRRLLVESGPSVLRNLKVAGVGLEEIEVVFLSHCHADHTFGWPFLFFTSLSVERRTAPLWVVGPPGIGAFLENMVKAGALDHLVEQVVARTGGFPLHFVEVDEQEQTAGGVRFRAARVEHDPVLDCYGYVIEHEGRRIGYSGDTILCDGLRRIAAASDVLVLECTLRHGVIPVHMNLDDVRTLRQEFPELPFVLTHRGEEISAEELPNLRVPKDFEILLV